MFKRYLAGWIFVWLLLVLGCIGMLYNFSSESKIAYQQLMNEGDQAGKGQEENGPAQQARHQVSKQILYQKGLQRMQVRLASDSSDLIYSKKEGKFVERFKSLTCTMQEKMIHASNVDESSQETSTPAETTQQMVRQLKAGEALYSYKSGQLEAQEVEIAHFLLPGTQWPQSLDDAAPLFQGKAHTVELSLFKEPTLKAQGFQAIFHQWGND